MAQVLKDRAERFLKFLYANRARFVHDLTDNIYQLSLGNILSGLKRSKLEDRFEGPPVFSQGVQNTEALHTSLKKIADFYTNKEVDFKTTVSNPQDAKMTIRGEITGPFTEPSHFVAIWRELSRLHPKDPLLKTLILQVLPKYEEYKNSKDSVTYLEFMKSAGFIDENGGKIFQPVAGTLAERVKSLVDEYLQRKIVETRAKSQQKFLRFTVPANAARGSAIDVLTPEGGVVRVKLPQEAREGQTIRVEYALEKKFDRAALAETRASDQRDENISTSASNPKALSAAQTVAVPAGLDTIYKIEDFPKVPDAKNAETQRFRICWLLSRKLSITYDTSEMYQIIESAKVLPVDRNFGSFTEEQFQDWNTEMMKALEGIEHVHFQNAFRVVRDFEETITDTEISRTNGKLLLTYISILNKVEKMREICLKSKPFLKLSKFEAWELRTMRQTIIKIQISKPSILRWVCDLLDLYKKAFQPTIKQRTYFTVLTRAINRAWETR